jgi:hypothetical protein
LEDLRLNRQLLILGTAHPLKELSVVIRGKKYTLLAMLAACHNWAGAGKAVVATDVPFLVDEDASMIKGVKDRPLSHDPDQLQREDDLRRVSAKGVKRCRVRDVPLKVTGQVNHDCRDR